MEYVSGYLSKIIDNPYASLLIALAISFGFAKYSYKINYFTKERYKKYLLRRITRASFTLFGRRDAFLAALLLRCVMTISSGVLLCTVMVAFFLAKLHESSFQNERSVSLTYWGFLGLIAVGAFLHFGGIFRLVREMDVLLAPGQYLTSLRREIESSDKRELLVDSEIAHFGNLIDRLDANLPKLKRMSLDEAAEPDSITLFPSSEA